ncbi:hypothetical protein UFOVP426_29 [uncultured Caudovirales phage]|uniref:Uncharacterized protein n=1 Tax=uncultured Caudovirales phage TaxID=2100421 RepID=A0A6J5M6G9_9CAUD|nr:hypothetical protein UFOVP426_29 [uncultured Caudovirales phage]
MTHKQKAEELVNKFYNIVYLDIDYEKAKYSALIAVNQLIEYQDYFMDYVRMDLPSNVVAGLPYKYWDKVKKEIELL